MLPFFFYVYYITILWFSPVVCF